MLPFVVDKAVTVRFARNGKVTQTGAGASGVVVTANDVEVVHPKIEGTGAATAGSSAGISAIGTVGSYITGLVVRGKAGLIKNWDKHGVYLEYCSDFDLDKFTVDTIAYGGIIGLSCQDGHVGTVKVKNVTQPAGFVNSYGIGWSRDSSKTLAAAPVSQDIMMDGPTVDGVPSWEGFDSHGGYRITPRNFVAYNCYKGVAFTTSKDPSNVETWAPKNCIIENGVIDSKVDDGTCSNGVLFNGISTDAATGRISNITIIGHGKDVAAGSSDLGAMYLAETSGVQVVAVKTVRSAVAAVQAYTGNYDLNIVGLTAEDTWSNLFGATGTLYVRSNNNKITISGTRHVRGTKSATKVNDRGIYLVGDMNTEVIDGGGNNWNACTTPAVGTAGRIRTMFGQVAGAVCNALPAVGVWDRGAPIYSTVAAAGASPGWIVTTAGGAGAAWAATIAKAAGAWVKSTAGGRAFEATVAGTTGGAEPAAFATAAVGDTVVDGTVTWTCRATAQAVFNAMPAVAA